jgi:hypothetical protein
MEEVPTVVEKEKIAGEKPKRDFTPLIGTRTFNVTDEIKETFQMIEIAVGRIFNQSVKFDLSKITDKTATQTIESTESLKSQILLEYQKIRNNHKCPIVRSNQLDLPIFVKGTIKMEEQISDEIAYDANYDNPYIKSTTAHRINSQLIFAHMTQAVQFDIDCMIKGKLSKLRCIFKNSKRSRPRVKTNENAQTVIVPQQNNSNDNINSNNIPTHSTIAQSNSTVTPEKVSVIQTLRDHLTSTAIKSANHQQHHHHHHLHHHHNQNNSDSSSNIKNNNKSSNIVSSISNNDVTNAYQPTANTTTMTSSSSSSPSLLPSFNENDNKDSSNSFAESVLNTTPQHLPPFSTITSPAFTSQNSIISNGHQYHQTQSINNNPLNTSITATTPCHNVVNQHASVPVIQHPSVIQPNGYTQIPFSQPIHANSSNHHHQSPITNVVVSAPQMSTPSVALLEPKIENVEAVTPTPKEVNKPKVEILKFEDVTPPKMNIDIDKKIKMCFKNPTVIPNVDLNCHNNGKKAIENNSTITEGLIDFEEEILPTLVKAPPILKKINFEPAKSQVEEPLKRVTNSTLKQQQQSITPSSSLNYRNNNVETPKKDAKPSEPNNINAKSENKIVSSQNSANSNNISSQNIKVSNVIVKNDIKVPHVEHKNVNPLTSTPKNNVKKSSANVSNDVDEIVDLTDDVDICVDLTKDVYKPRMIADITFVSCQTEPLKTKPMPSSMKNINGDYLNMSKSRVERRAMPLSKRLKRSAYAIDPDEVNVRPAKVHVVDCMKNIDLDNLKLNTPIRLCHDSKQVKNAFQF